MSKFLFFFVFSFMFLFHNVFICACSKEQVNEILNTFSKSEKKSLLLFFEEVVFNDNFVYTIFGTKPISYAGYFAWPQYLGPRVLKHNHITLYKSEALCRKCNAFFAKNNLVFKIQNNSEHEWSGIYLINKREFLKTVETNLDLFKDIIGCSITPEALLSKVLEENTTLEEALRFHEGLKGIILGYGVANSLLFHRKQELQKAIPIKYAPPIAPSNDSKISHFISYEQKRVDKDKIKVSKITPSDAFENIIEEYKTIKSRLQGCGGSDEVLHFCSLPSFLGDPEDPETNMLLQEYEQTRKEIAKACKERDFLEIIICKFLEN